MKEDISIQYSFDKVGSKEYKARKLDGPTTEETGTNSVGDPIVTLFSESSMGSFIHELRHGGQVARKNLILGSNGNYSVEHEISAYRAQFAWNGVIRYAQYIIMIILIIF